MTLAEFEARFQCLRDQLCGAWENIGKLQGRQGWKLESAFVAPPIDPRLATDSPEPQQLIEHEQAQLDALNGVDPRQRGAIARVFELNEPFWEAETDLACALYTRGQTVSQIAERLGTAVEAVQNMLGVPTGRMPRFLTRKSRSQDSTDTI